MTASQFWQLIDSSKGKIGISRAKLVRGLNKLPEHEVVSFQRHFERYLARAYTWDLWGAAYLIEDGCSDDGFLDFRNGLIGLGRKIYEQGVTNPDTLARLDLDWISNEAIGFAANAVYERKTGRALPPAGSVRSPKKPKGVEWTFEIATGLNQRQYKQRLPKLWAKKAAVERAEKEVVFQEIVRGRSWRVPYNHIEGKVCEDIIGFSHSGEPAPCILFIKVQHDFWFRYTIYHVGAGAKFQSYLQSIREKDMNETQHDETKTFPIGKKARIAGKKIVSMSFQNTAGAENRQVGSFTVKFSDDSCMKLQDDNDLLEFTFTRSGRTLISERSRFSDTAF